jgi:hypothetical protein
MGKNLIFHLFKINRVAFLPLLISMWIVLAEPLRAQEEEDTYSISLVQTVEVDKEIRRVGDMKVLTETYTVREGDRIWQVFRERGLLKKRNLSELLTMLKELNESLTNLDLIYPGEKIIIPLVISPVEGMLTAAAEAAEAPEATIPIESLKELDLEEYTIVPGDSIIKVIKTQYDIPEEDLYGEYLQAVKRLNPSIKDLDKVYPGQIIRLPIYSPEMIRKPIKKAALSEPEPAAPSIESGGLASQLRELFIEMGEEWIDSGQHFIPLKSGGQISLAADSYPILNLGNGNRIILDLNHDLPEKMSRLIESSWANYRIVHLENDDKLRSAVDKILSACGYPQIFRLGEPFEMEGDIALRITADWIIKAGAEPSQDTSRVIVLTFVDSSTQKTPWEVRRFLTHMNIKAVDYPLSMTNPEQPTEDVEILRSGNNLSTLLELLLHLAGHRFSTDVEIPVYRSAEQDFNLIITANYFLNLDGRDAIIDLNGLGPELISLLKDHRLSVLTLAHETNLTVIVSRILDFIGAKFDPGPYTFMAAEREESRNIRVSIPGISFETPKGEKILATELDLTEDLSRFLSRKGLKILILSFTQ